MAKSQFESISHKRLLWILFVLSYFLLMYGNGLLSLTHPDEVFYIQTAREMVEHNSWLTPMIFGHVQFEKPIIPYFLFAVAIKFFGVKSYVARFWPAFFGIAGVGVTYWIAWMIFQRKKIAFLSGIILASSFIYILLSRAVLTDMIFTTLVSSSIGFFYLSLKDKSRHWQGIFLGFIFCALAVLTKGILGFIFPVTTVVMYLVWSGQLKKVNLNAVLLGSGVFILIALPWHLMMYKKFGAFFIQEYFQNVHVRRLFEAEHPSMSTFYFYPVIMIFGILPWSFFWFLTIRKIWQDFKDQNDRTDGIKLLLSWIVCVFIPVELAVSKLASYVFPLFPALAILLGMATSLAMDEKLERTPSRRFMKQAGWMIFIFISLSAIALLVVCAWYPEFISNMGPLYVAFGLFLTCAVGVITFCYLKEYARMIFAIVSFSGAVLFCLILAMPQLESWTSCKNICKVFNKMNLPKELIFSSKILARGVHFYTGNPVAVIDINGQGFWSQHPIPYFNMDQQIINYMNKNKELYAIIRDKTFEDFDRLLQSQPYEIEEIYAEGGKKILHMTRKFLTPDGR